jgi:ADP-heptose:LPS heptosyltransferase
MPESPHILVIRRRYLGDVVLLGSLLRNLRLHRPQAKLAVLVEARFADVLALNPDVDSTLRLPAGLGEWPRFLRALRAARFTHVLDLDNTEKTAAIARLSGAAQRLALHHGGRRVRFRAAYTNFVHDSPAEHEARPITDYYLRVLEPLGVPLATREIRLAVADAAVAEARRFIGASPRVLLVHPGSRSAMRIWPAERFAAVCDFAQDQLDAQAVLVGGPGDETLLAEIRGHARTHLFMPPGPMPIARFAALAKASSVLLCHDSGPMHVAAAVGTRVIALYGSQNAALFRPMGEGHVLLQPPLPCTNCVAPDRCIPGDSYRNLCVRHLSVERVNAAVQIALR